MLILLYIVQGSDEEKLIITKIQAHEEQKYLLKIDSNKSVGPDEISPRLLKECCVQLETPITSLLNKSLTQARVPRAWKRVNITPRREKRNKLLTIDQLVQWFLNLFILLPNLTSHIRRAIVVTTQVYHIIHFL